MVRLLARIAAFGLTAAIIFLTLGPQSDRPKTGHPQSERFLAYALVGAAFAVGFPRQRAWVALGVAAAAVGLEAGQLLAPGRDAGVPDAIAKALGGLTGVAVAAAAERLATRAQQGDGRR